MTPAASPPPSALLEDFANINEERRLEMIGASPTDPPLLLAFDRRGSEERDVVSGGVEGVTGRRGRDQQLPVETVSMEGGTSGVSDASEEEEANVSSSAPSSALATSNQRVTQLAENEDFPRTRSAHLERRRSSRRRGPQSPRFSFNPDLLGPPRGSIPPTKSYSGFVLTAGVFMPAMVSAHLLAPEAVTVCLLFLPACAVLSQGVVLPSGCSASCVPGCRQCMNFEAIRNCFQSPASRIKASVVAGSLAPLICIAAVVLKVPWVCHVSLLPLTLSLLLLWPKIWCWLSCGLQLHLELILCNAYIFTLPYSGSNSWFVCAVFCAAISFFPISGYLALRMHALEPFARARVPCRFQKRVLCLSAFICSGWGAAVVALVVNIFFLHQTDSPALRAVLQGEALVSSSSSSSVSSSTALLAPGDAASEAQLSEQLVVEERLRRESVWLAGVSAFVALVGIAVLFLTLKWDPWVRVEASRAAALAAEETNRQGELLAEAVAAAVAAEQQARFNIIRENVKRERLSAESALLGTVCSICQDSLAENHNAATMPTCGHAFHWECVALWLRRKPTCPNCQLDVHREVLAQRTREEAASAALCLANAHLAPPLSSDATFTARPQALRQQSSGVQSVDFELPQVREEAQGAFRRGGSLSERRNLPLATLEPAPVDSRSSQQPPVQQHSFWRRNHGDEFVIDPSDAWIVHSSADPSRSSPSSSQPNAAPSSSLQEVV